MASTFGKTGAPRRVLGEIVGLYWDSGLGNDVPALAWFLLSSLVPLALGITALAAVVLGDYAKAQELATRVSDVLPKDVHDQLVQLILRTQRDSPLLIAGSILAMVWTCSGAVGVLARCVSRVLERPEGSIVLGKLRNVAVSGALTLAIVLMVVVASAGTGLLKQIELDSVLVRIAVPLVCAGILALICAIVYWVLAGTDVRRAAALAGGSVAGIVLLATPTAAGYYLRFVSGRTPVELFLMLSGVLITCYIGAFGLLLGVGVTARVHLGRRLTNPSQPRAGTPRTSG